MGVTFQTGMINFECRRGDSQRSTPLGVFAAPSMLELPPANWLLAVPSIRYW
jgi:hypothetical protein